MGRKLFRKVTGSLEGDVKEKETLKEKKAGVPQSGSSGTGLSSQSEGGLQFCVGWSWLLQYSVVILLVVFW